MKTPINKILLIALPLVAASALSSCVSDGYGGGGGYITYATLPPNYSGNAYYYNNRYYSGGRYESGRYSYGGRTYTTRYYYNGQYLYGGNYRQPSSSRSYQSRSPRPPASPGYSTYNSRPSSPPSSSYRPGSSSYRPGSSYYSDGRVSSPSRSGQERSRDNQRGGSYRSSRSSY